MLAALNRSGDSGALVVTSPAGVERRLLFVDGELRTARSSLEEEKLVTWLVCRGRISEEERALVLLGMVDGDGRPAGMRLVERALLGPAELDRELQALALHIICECARELPKKLVFVEPLPSLPQDDLPDVVTRQAILEVARLLPDEQLKRSALRPAELLVFANRTLSGILEELELTPVEAFLISRMDGTRSLSHLIGSCGVPEPTAVNALYALKMAGLIELGSTSPARALRQVRGRPVVDVSSLSAVEIAEREQIAELARRLRELDHYSALGLKTSATASEIETAWHEYLARYSPDRMRERHLADREAELAAIVIRAENAYEVLSSPVSRARYDAILRATLESGEGAPGARPKAPDPRQLEARREMAEANLRRADELVALGELHLATQALEQVVAFRPDASALVKLARLQRRNPQWVNRAFDSLRKAVELEPESVEAWLEMAEHWHLRGHAERQRKSLERVLAIDCHCEVALEMYEQSFGQRQLRKVLERLAE